MKCERVVINSGPKCNSLTQSLTQADEHIDTTFYRLDFSLQFGQFLCYTCLFKYLLSVYLHENLVLTTQIDAKEVR